MEDEEATEYENIGLDLPELQPKKDLRKPFIRPPSYSDSFLIVSGGKATVTSLSPKPLDVPFSVLKPRFDFVWWYEKFVSLSIHISLISLFETIFFFQFISKSEDEGLLKTVDGYVYDLADSCAVWPANVTSAVRQILQLVISAQNVSAIAADAASRRSAANTHLQIQSWIYFAAITSLTAAVSAFAVYKKYRFHWRRVIIENIAMVTLLGFYEFVFFRTIIYNYESLSMPEIDQHIVQILQKMCGLF